MNQHVPLLGQQNGESLFPVHLINIGLSFFYLKLKSLFFSSLHLFLVFQLQIQSCINSFFFFFKFQSSGVIKNSELIPLKRKQGIVG